VTDRLPSLLLVAASTEDVVMFVRSSSGEVACDDDSGGWPSALLRGRDVLPGRYEIWIATWSAGATATYTLHVSTRPLPPDRVGAYPGVPTDCGLATADYGPITFGSTVVLGAHSGWTGPDGRGGTVLEDTWWNVGMWDYVGREATVVELGGLDPAGCPYVRVDLDEGTWGWRIRDLSPALDASLGDSVTLPGGEWAARWR
jgi:hypothetical protein